jgi:hypothetical protein
MPLSGISVNNPQEQNPISENPISTTGNDITFGGNALGSGASTATSGSPTFSTILLYGAIALVVIFILQRLEKK